MSHPSITKKRNLSHLVKYSIQVLVLLRESVSDKFEKWAHFLRFIFHSYWLIFHWYRFYWIRVFFVDHCESFVFFLTVARRDINNRQRRIGASTGIDFCSQPSNPYGMSFVALKIMKKIYIIYLHVVLSLSFSLVRHLPENSFSLSFSLDAIKYWKEM